MIVVLFTVSNVVVWHTWICCTGNCASWSSIMYELLFVFNFFLFSKNDLKSMLFERMNVDCRWSGLVGIGSVDVWNVEWQSAVLQWQRATIVGRSESAPHTYATLTMIGVCVCHRSRARVKHRRCRLTARRVDKRKSLWRRCWTSDRSGVWERVVWPACARATSRHRRLAAVLVATTALRAGWRTANRRPTTTT